MKAYGNGDRVQVRLYLLPIIDEEPLHTMSEQNKLDNNGMAASSNLISVLLNSYTSAANLGT